MSKILLDTNIVIDLLKQDTKVLPLFLKMLNDGVQYYYNPIVSAEIYAGAFKKERPIIEQFFSKLQHVDIDNETGIEAGKYANTFKKAYHKISLEDYLIASSAKVHNLTLWTHNKKHYPMHDIKII